MWNEKPAKFGPLHLGFIVLALVLFGLGIYFGNKYKDERYAKKRNWFLAGVGFFLIALEIVKILLSVVWGEGGISLIPFQICSTPMYLLPLFPILKEGKVKDAVVGYLSTVALAAALCYYVNPSAMTRTYYVFLSLHSGAYHAILAGTLSFVLCVHEVWNKKGFFKALVGYAIFTIFSLVAVGANFAVNAANPEAGLFLFYLHPDAPVTFPVIDTLVKPYVPFVVYYLLFLVIFFLIALLHWGIATLVILIQNKIKAKKAA